MTYKSNRQCQSGKWIRRRYRAFEVDIFPTPSTKQLGFLFRTFLKHSIFLAFHAIYRNMPFLFCTYAIQFVVLSFVIEPLQSPSPEVNYKQNKKKKLKAARTLSPYLWAFPPWIQTISHSKCHVTTDRKWKRAHVFYYNTAVHVLVKQRCSFIFFSSLSSLPHSRLFADKRVQNVRENAVYRTWPQTTTANEMLCWFFKNSALTYREGWRAVGKHV